MPGHRPGKNSGESCTDSGFLGAGMRGSGGRRRRGGQVGYGVLLLTVLGLVASGCGGGGKPPANAPPANAPPANSVPAGEAAKPENPLAYRSIEVQANTNNEGIIDATVHNGTGANLDLVRWQGSPAQKTCGGSSLPAAPESRVTTGGTGHSCTSNRSAFTGQRVTFVYRIDHAENGTHWYLHGDALAPFTASGQKREQNFARCVVSTSQDPPAGWPGPKGNVSEPDSHAPFGCEVAFRAKDPKTRDPMPSFSVFTPKVITDADQALALLEKTCTFELTGHVPAVKDLPAGARAGAAYGVTDVDRIYVWDAQAGGQWRNTGEPAPPPGAACKAGKAETVKVRDEQILPAFQEEPRLAGSSHCNAGDRELPYTQTWTYTTSITNEVGVEAHFGVKVGYQPPSPTGGITGELNFSVGSRYTQSWSKSTQFSETSGPMAIPVGKEGGFFVAAGKLVDQADWIVANPPKNVPAKGEGGAGTFYYLKGFVLRLPVAQGKEVPNSGTAGTPLETTATIPSRRVISATWEPKVACKVNPVSGTLQKGAKLPRGARIVKEQ